jgi:hypothetical protein
MDGRRQPGVELEHQVEVGLLLGGVVAAMLVTVPAQGSMLVVVVVVS